MWFHFHENRKLKRRRFHLISIETFKLNVSVTFDIYDAKTGVSYVRVVAEKLVSKKYSFTQSVATWFTINVHLTNENI